MYYIIVMTWGQLIDFQLSQTAKMGATLLKTFQYVVGTCMTFILKIRNKHLFLWLLSYIYIDTLTFL